MRRRASSGFFLAPPPRTRFPAFVSTSDPPERPGSLERLRPSSAASRCTDSSASYQDPCQEWRRPVLVLALLLIRSGARRDTTRSEGPGLPGTQEPWCGQTPSGLPLGWTAAREWSEVNEMVGLHDYLYVCILRQRIKRQKSSTMFDSKKTN